MCKIQSYFKLEFQYETYVPAKYGRTPQGTKFLRFGFYGISDLMYDFTSG